MAEYLGKDELSIITYGALMKKIKGAVSGIASITSTDTPNPALTIIMNDGQSTTIRFRDPEDGVSIVGARIEPPGKLYIKYSDGTESLAGDIPGNTISKKTGNLLKQDGGLYVGTELTKNGAGDKYLADDGKYYEIRADISPKPGNLLVDYEGLYVGTELTKNGKGDKYLADDGKYYEIDAAVISPLAGNELIDKEGIYLSKEMLGIPEVSVGTARPSGKEVFWIKPGADADEPAILSYKSGTSWVTIKIGSDGKVKMNESADAQYLEDLIDNDTIRIDEGKLYVKKLDGQLCTITEVNYLKGAKSNIQAQIDMLTGVKSIYGVFDTKAALDADPGDPEDGQMALIRKDEGYEDKQTSYVYVKDTWEILAEVSMEVRDFTTDPIDLTKEVTKRLPRENIEKDFVDLVEILDTEGDGDKYLSDDGTYKEINEGKTEIARDESEVTDDTVLIIGDLDGEDCPKASNNQYGVVRVSTDDHNALTVDSGVLEVKISKDPDNALKVTPSGLKSTGGGSGVVVREMSERTDETILIVGDPSATPIPHATTTQYGVVKISADSDNALKDTANGLKVVSGGGSDFPISTRTDNGITYRGDGYGVFATTIFPRNALKVTDGGLAVKLDTHRENIIVDDEIEGLSVKPYVHGYVRRFTGNGTYEVESGDTAEVGLNYWLKIYSEDGPLQAHMVFVYTDNPSKCNWVGMLYGGSRLLPLVANNLEVSVRSGSVLVVKNTYTSKINVRVAAMSVGDLSTKN